jgi:hypothetical protein
MPVNCPLCGASLLAVGPDHKCAEPPPLGRIEVSLSPLQKLREGKHALAEPVRDIQGRSSAAGE